ncbi:hypothetical protein A2U01_0105321, partial [Trifolium medium]|nr:hypothetical protein [Trifolium medium]
MPSLTLSHNLSSQLYKLSSLTHTQNSVCATGCDEDNDVADDFVTPNFDLCAT